MTEPKSAVKKAQSSQAAKQAETKEAAEKKAPSRKEQLAADRPVARSGLYAEQTHDEANPAFAIDTSK